MPGSGSGSSSRSSSPPLQLDPSTLAALSSFYDERAEADRQFQELEKKAHERLVAAQEQGRDAGQSPAVDELLSGQPLAPWPRRFDTSELTMDSLQTQVSLEPTRESKPEQADNGGWTKSTRTGTDNERRRVPETLWRRLAALAILVRLAFLCLSTAALRAAPMPAPVLIDFARPPFPAPVQVLGLVRHPVLALPLFALQPQHKNRLPLVPDRLHRVPAREPAPGRVAVGVRHAVQTRRRRQIRPLQLGGTRGVPRGTEGDGRYRDCGSAILERGACLQRRPLQRASHVSDLASADGIVSPWGPIVAGHEPILCNDAPIPPEAER